MLYLWLPFIGLLASAFSTVAGFGAGIVLISFASMVMDIKEVGLAVLVLGYCANMLLKLIPERRPSSQVTTAVSAVAGLVDAVTASGGTIQAPLFLARGLRKEVFVASFAATSVLLNPLAVLLLFLLGLKLLVESCWA